IRTDTAHPVSELRAPRKQGYAGAAQFKTFVTKPDAVPHHDWIFVQGLSAALSAPAQALQTLLNTSLDCLIWNRLRIGLHDLPLGFRLRCWIPPFVLQQDCDNPSHRCDATCRCAEEGDATK